MTTAGERFRRIDELRIIYAEKYPLAKAEEVKRWAVESAQYEADEREAIQNEK
jgi:hypothetical protein